MDAFLLSSHSDVGLVDLEPRLLGWLFVLPDVLFLVEKDPVEEEGLGVLDRVADPSRDFVDPLVLGV